MDCAWFTLLSEQIFLFLLPVSKTASNLLNSIGANNVDFEKLTLSNEKENEGLLQATIPWLLCKIELQIYLSQQCYFQGRCGTGLI